MKTKNEIYEDSKFTNWAVKQKYYVSHYVGVEPIYMNDKDDPDTADMGQRCYTIEEVYEIYETEEEEG